MNNAQLDYMIDQRKATVSTRTAEDADWRRMCRGREVALGVYRQFCCRCKRPMETTVKEDRSKVMLKCAECRTLDWGKILDAR